jgi:hypothetical protein
MEVGVDRYLFEKVEKYGLTDTYFSVDTNLGVDRYLFLIGKEISVAMRIRFISRSFSD